MACATAGVDRQGLPREGAGSEPLCLPCWRGRRERAGVRERRQLVAALREDLAVVDEACVACGSLRPAPGCWLCDWSWLAQARAAFEADQAAQRAAEAAAFERLAECSEAEDQVAALSAWVDRLRATVDAYAAESGRGRAVELLADLLARDAATRSTGRGRPGALARVAAVLAVDADWRSGRRSRPGRARTAELVGCTERAVTSAWARAQALGWCVRTAVGRRLSLAERVESGRWCDRAQFDVTPVHRGDPVARAAKVAAALAVLAQLLERAVGLLQAARERVDELRARAGSWVERAEAAAAAARRAELRAAVSRAWDLATSHCRDWTVAPVGDGAHCGQDHGLNIFPPHVVSQGEYQSSCSSWGLAFSPSIAARSADGAGRPASGREGGASRAPSGGGVDLGGEWCGPQRVKRPRSLKGQPGRSRQQAGRAPAWAAWAYPLARELRQRWTWLREAPLPRVAATLGAALGSDWTAEDLIGWVQRQRSQRLLDEPRDPVAYLRAVLRDVLDGPAAPPHPARRHAERRRQAATDAADQAAGRLATTRATWQAREAAAAAERAGAGAARRAALAAAAAASRGDHGAARAIATAPHWPDWPQVTPPGGGLPTATQP